jgi:glutaredoxin
MKSKAVFYHAGCPVCVDAEQGLAHKLDPVNFDVKIVHLGEQKSLISEARGQGVKSVPALLIDGQVFHINFGAALSDLS